MLFRYNKNLKKINKCDQTDFKSHDILERQDIEKWVEEYPDVLGEKLLIITTEYDKFDKTNERLDLLAMDKNGNLVIIELKRDDSGKNVDLQAIKYAAYCSTLTFDQVVKEYQDYHRKKSIIISEEEAKSQIRNFIDDDDFNELNNRPRIIIASKEYRPEVTASVLWLRNFGIDITCVKLTPYEIDKDYIGLESTILIPLPEAKDYIIQSERKENIEYTKTSIQNEEYLTFFKELIEMMPNGDYLQPQAKSYYQIATVISGVHFEWVFRNSLKGFGVELVFHKGDKKINEKLLNQVEEKVKIRLEQSLKNENVVFDKDYRENWSRIYILKNEAIINEELKTWAVENMKIFMEIIQPELDKMKS